MPPAHHIRRGAGPALVVWVRDPHPPLAAPHRAPGAPSADLAHLLSWRNDPQLTQWLLSTTVDPASYRAAWLTDVDDPLDHSGGALLDGVVIGTATLHVRDAMGQGDKAADSP